MRECPEYGEPVTLIASGQIDLYQLERELGEAGMHSPADIEAVSNLLYAPKTLAHRLYTVLRPVLDRYNDADDETRMAHRSGLQRYIRLYSFLSQILTFEDADLLRLYHFCRVVLRNLPETEGDLPPDIERKVQLEQYDLRETHKGPVPLVAQNGELPAVDTGGEGRPSEDDEDLLSRIIEELNTQHGVDLKTKTGSAYLHEFLDQMLSSEALQASVRVNPPDTARLTFNHLADEHVQDTIDFNMQMFKLLNDHPDYRDAVFNQMWRIVLPRLQEAAEGE